MHPGPPGTCSTAIHVYNKRHFNCTVIGRCARPGVRLGPLRVPSAERVLVAVANLLHGGFVPFQPERPERPPPQLRRLQVRLGCALRAAIEPNTQRIPLLPSLRNRPNPTTPVSRVGATQLRAHPLVESTVVHPKSSSLPHSKCRPASFDHSAEIVPQLRPDSPT